jgi:hypothetical protein
VEKLAPHVDKVEKIGVKLIVSAHALERISQVASTTGISKRIKKITGTLRTTFKPGGFPTMLNSNP